MLKIAILGVESSGKTVLLSGLGGQYARADANGMFLVPESRETMSYVNRQLAAIRRGEWPAATTPDTMQRLEWSLRCCGSGVAPVQLGILNVLDFAGEVYRAAFEGASTSGFESKVKALKEYVSEASALAVLINLSDLITNGDMDERVQSMVWATKKILDFVIQGLGSSGGCDLKHRVALVFTQADRYEATIRSYANLRAMFETLLPMISQSYGGLDILTASVVDRTTLNDDGLEVPDAKLSETGMSELWNWLVSRCKSENRAKLMAERILAEITSTDLYSAHTVPPKKLDNAHRSMKIREPKEDVLLLFDGTVFGSSEEGMVITSKAIYGKDWPGDPFCITLEDEWAVSKDGSNLVFAQNGQNHKVLIAGLGDVKLKRMVDILGA